MEPEQVQGRVPQRDPERQLEQEPRQELRNGYAETMHQAIQLILKRRIAFLIPSLLKRLAHPGRGRIYTHTHLLKILLMKH